MPRLFYATALALLAAATACDQLNSWRDGQVQQSHQLAQGSQVTPPAQPVEVPDDVRRELPLDSSFTILTYSPGSPVTVTALSPWEAEKTALWLVGKLGELGYDSGDNPSRVLEGATYACPTGRYRMLYVKLGLNTSDQVTVEYRASSQ